MKILYYICQIVMPALTRKMADLKDEIFSKIDKKFN